MIITLILGILTWAGTKAFPAIYRHHIEQEKQQIELAKDLCQNHNDCEAEKAYAMKGLKHGRRTKTVTGSESIQLHSE